MKNMDYIFLVYGLSFLAIAVVLFGKRKTGGIQLPWPFLACFGLLHGINEWLDMFALGMGDSPWFKIARLIILAFSFILLLEFGRRGAIAQGLKLPGAWFMLIPVGLGGLGAMAGPDGLNAAFRYSLGLPGGLWAGWVLFRHSRALRGISRHAFRASSLGFAAYGLAAGLVTPDAGFPPSTLLNQEAFLEAFGFPIQIVRMICAALCAMSLYVAFLKPREGEDAYSTWDWTIPAGLFLLLSIGIWAVNLQGDRVDGELRRSLLVQATSIARTINPERLKALSFTEKDSKSPEFQRLRGYMAAYGEAIGCRGIYSLALRDDNLLFGPEFYAKNDPHASKPGTAYRKPSPKIWGIFNTGQALTIGPYTDEFGDFVSALAPVRDPLNGRVLVVIGVDIEAAKWKSQVMRSRFMAILGVLALSLLVMAGALLLKMRAWLPPEKQGWLRYAEVYLLAVCGIMLTAIWTVLVSSNENLTQREEFSHQAETDITHITEIFQILRDENLKAIGGLFELNEFIPRIKFRNFTQSIFRRNIIAEIGWAPKVPAEKRTEFENGVRIQGGDQGIYDFTIYQKDALGRKSPVNLYGEPYPLNSMKDSYPVLYTEPLDAIESGIGFDLASEAVRWAAISETIDTGMATASDMIRRISNNEEGINLFRPVYYDGMKTLTDSAGLVRPAKPIGVVYITLRMDEFLEKVLSGRSREKALTVADMYQIAPGRAPKFLASSAPGETMSHKQGMALKGPGYKDYTNIDVVMPLFIFGKSYLFSMHPGQAFWVSHPERSAWSTVLVGTLLTALLTILASFFTIRRADLETKVRTRTAQLVDSEEHLGATLRSIGDGVISTDAKGRVTNLNSAAEALTGWTMSEARGFVIKEVFHIVNSQTRIRAENPVSRVIDEGIAADLANNTSLIARDGTERQIEHSCAPIRDAFGKIRGAVLVFRDISAQYEAREEIQETNMRLNQLAEQSRTVAWEVNHEGLYIYVNHVSETVFGYKPEELIGKLHFYDLHPEDGCDEFIEAAFAFIDRKEPFRDFESRALTKDGREIWISTSGLPVFDHKGNFLCCRGANTEITERKKAEDEIRRSREQFMLAVDGSNDGIWDWDLREGSLYLSPKWKRMIGYEDDEFANTFATFEEHLHPEDRPKVKNYLDGYLRGDSKLYSIEFRFRKKSGDYLWILARGTALRDESGKAFRMAGSHTDITERKHFEEEITEANQRLELSSMIAEEMAEEAKKANKAKSEFLANMSHEIRTPMNGVIGMTGLLLDTDLSPEQLQYAQIVKTSGEALLSVLNDILDFSKIEAKKLELETLNFDLRQTMEDTAELLAVKAQEKGLDIVCLIDAKVPLHLKGDPGRLRQVFLNLGGNAVKFTGHGGVTISADVQWDDDSKVKLFFAVTDTGIGVPAEKQDKLFSPFFQVDGSTTRRFGGTGLGLAISKQLVELMGGQIGVTSKDGQGSKFWFTGLFEKQSEGTVVYEPISAELAGVRVLVVDDHEINRLLVSTLLTGWGCRYQEAISGQGALMVMNQAARANDPFKIALLDMQMPGMNGEVLGRKIKASPLLRDTQLIMMTSMAGQDDTRKLTRIGFAGYLTKPIRKEQFRACLVNVLGSRGQPKECDVPVKPPIMKAVPKADGSTHRVLLVEDNATNQLVSLKILQKLGYDADVASNGLEALDALQAKPYDLVLMDCQMPEMDGFEATSIIRNWRLSEDREETWEAVLKDHVSRIPIIAMTANAMKGDRERCLEAGMDVYLSKPVNPRELAETLRRQLLKNHTASDVLPSFEEAEDQARPSVGEAVTFTREEDRFLTDEVPDFDKAGFLSRLMDEEDMIRSVSELFLSDMPRQIKKLVSAVDKGDCLNARKLAHKIKGAAANVGGEALKEMALAMENAAGSDKAETLKTLLPELEKSFERLKNAMEREI